VYFAEELRYCPLIFTGVVYEVKCWSVNYLLSVDLYSFSVRHWSVHLLFVDFYWCSVHRWIVNYLLFVDPYWQSVRPWSVNLLSVDLHWCIVRRWSTYVSLIPKFYDPLSIMVILPTILCTYMLWETTSHGLIIINLSVLGRWSESCNIICEQSKFETYITWAVTP